MKKTNLNLEKILKSNVRYTNLVSNILDQIKDKGERYDFILKLMGKRVTLPGKYVQEVFTETENCHYFTDKDWRKVITTFRKAGYKTLADKLNSGYFLI